MQRRNRCRNWLQKREDDDAERAERTRAVDMRGLFQLIRYAFDEADVQKACVGHAHAGQHDDLACERVEKPHCPEQLVDRNHHDLERQHLRAHERFVEEPEKPV